MVQNLNKFSKRKRDDYGGFKDIGWIKDLKDKGKTNTSLFWKVNNGTACKLPIKESFKKLFYWSLISQSIYDYIKGSTEAFHNLIEQFVQNL